MIRKNSYEKNDIKKILNSLPGMVYQCLYDQNWTMKYVSKGCFNLTGYEVDDLVENKSVTFSDLIFEKDKSKGRDKIEEAVKNNSKFKIEYRIKTNEDEIKWVWEQGSAIYDENGDVKYLLGFITDITENKLKNKKLKETKQRLELAIKGANLGIWDWNVTDKTMTINDNWAEMLGYQKDEIKPTSSEWEKLLHPEDKQHVFNKLKDHLDGKTNYYEAEQRLKTKDGNYKWIRDIGKVFERDDKGNALRAVGIHLDIDKTKRMNNILKESEQKFRTYIENAPVGIFVTDDKGNIKEINKHAVKMTDYDKEELLNMSLVDLSVKEKREVDYILKKFESREKIELEDKFIKKNGNKFYAKVNGIVIGENKFLGFVEDIDRRVKMENRLKKQKAYFEQLFNESTEGIVLLNNKGTVLKVNNFFLDIFEYYRDEVLGANIDELITPEDKKDEGVYYTEEVMDGKDIIDESIRKTKTGEKINVSIHAFPIKLEEGQIGIYGIYNDITERKQQEEKRRFLSFHDQLTELYNRRYFENEMERLNDSRKTPISIIVGDLDGLKGVNDNFGHRAGDQYIKSYCRYNQRCY
ncbi:MAG: PAS domain S-box protein [Halanaerobiales bacterium]|nr:PAS domain S-box protein [Halanaerobiales bacterium]